MATAEVTARCSSRERARAVAVGAVITVVGSIQECQTAAHGQPVSEQPATIDFHPICCRLSGVPNHGKNTGVSHGAALDLKVLVLGGKGHNVQFSTAVKEAAFHANFKGFRCFIVVDQAVRTHRTCRRYTARFGTFCISTKQHDIFGQVPFNGDLGHRICGTQRAISSTHRRAIGIENRKAKTGAQGAVRELKVHL